MKGLAWSEEKNEWLKARRGIGFELVALKVAAGQVLDHVKHSNQAKFPHQRIYVIEVLGYAYLVPYVESETEIFLKTIIPSRQATKRYLGKGQGT
jgi:hypothetical protein